MTDVVLIPSVLGVRPGIRQVADRLGAAGHQTHVVEVYADGLTFDAYEPAIAHWRSLGFDDEPTRAHDLVSGLPTDVVYAGFSAGAETSSSAWRTTSPAPVAPSSCSTTPATGTCSPTTDCPSTTLARPS